MRPKLLEIEGLQSFREKQTIDFDSLGETGLFGIFGPTGSGKSTVLDAITFVLYGKVKRAERGTQGIINTGWKTARVSFTFELFKDNIRKTYRVERTYQRKRGSGNSCEPKIARLIEITAAGEIPLCDRAKEVSRSIEELLGLSHDDFTRAVVLPQNSFQEFLMLDNAKKRDMLERIFYLEEYGRRLNEKLSKKVSVLKSRIDKVEGALSMLGDASDQALEDAENALKAAALERSRAEKELQQLEARFNEAKEVWQLVQSLEQIKKKEQQHCSHQEEISSKRIRLEKAAKAAELAELVGKTGRLAEKLAETEKRLDEILARLPFVAAEREETRGKFGGLKKEAETEKPKLVAFRTRLSDALEIKGELKQLGVKIGGLAVAERGVQEKIELKNNIIRRESREAADAEEKIKLLKGQIDSLKTDPQYRSKIQEGVLLESKIGVAEKSASELKKKIAKLNAEIAAREDELQAVSRKIVQTKEVLHVLTKEAQEHEEEKPAGRQAVSSEQEEIHKLEMVWGLLKLKKSELEAMQEKIGELQDLSDKTAAKLNSLEEERQKAEMFYRRSREQKEAAVKALEKNTAYLLSKKLQEGEPCPVCGSVHHPHPASRQGEEAEPALLEKELAAAEKELAAAEKALKKADQNYLLTAGQLQSIKEQLGQATGDLQDKRKEYDDVVQKLPEGLRKLDLPALGSALKKMNDGLRAKLKAVDEWEEKLETLKSNLMKQNERLSGFRAEENGLLSGLQVSRENLAHLENDFKKEMQSCQELKERYRFFLESFQIESAGREMERLAENDRKLNELQKEMEKVQELFGKKRASIEQLREEVGALTNERIKLEAHRKNYLQQQEEKERRLKALAGDVHIEEEIEKINRRLEAYQQLERQYEERLKCLEKEHHELQSQKATLENQKNIYAGTLESEKRRLQEALQLKGFADSAEVESSMLSEDEQKKLAEEISRYDEISRELQAEKLMVTRKLGSRSIDEEEWERISRAFEEKAMEKEACVSRHEVARNTYETIKKKHDKWVVLQKSYRELTHKQGLFEQIQKLLRAEKGKENSFIDFIAEERLRYVAAKASETLGLMTKYKYALELDTEAGFIIRDNANGGVHRMVTSLSGGETFLTSLALALALSEQIQLKGQSPLEFFFLDEGFGTLDSELLDMVMDSLERLSSRERVIGLISHVPELRSRLARRLIVEPPSYTGAGSRVRIEKG